MIRVFHLRQIILDRGRVHYGDFVVAVHIGCSFCDCEGDLYNGNVSLNPCGVSDLYVTVRINVAEDTGFLAGADMMILSSPVPI